MLGAILGAGVGLAQGLLGQSTANKNMQLQKDAMKEGIRWKVNDAKKAGIHPLYALGAPNFSPSPVQGGDFSGMIEPLSRMGQDIDRSSMAQQPSGARSMVTRVATRLAVERGGLENELLRTQIRRLQRETPPPVPAPGVKGDLPPGVSASQGGSTYDKDPTRLNLAVRNPDGSTSRIAVQNPNIANSLQGHYGETADWLSGVFGINDLSREAADFIARNYQGATKGWDWHRRFKPGRHR